MTIIFSGGAFSTVGQSFTFDPMVDFRSPQSLIEILHEGLVTIEGRLNSCCDSNDDIGSMLVAVGSELVKLNESYDSMVNRSKMHTVYSEDIEFLQKMIDKIDTMIHSLEKSVNLSDDNAVVLQQNIELLDQLHGKI